MTRSESPSIRRCLKQPPAAFRQRDCLRAATRTFRLASKRARWNDTLILLTPSRGSPPDLRTSEPFEEARGGKGELPDRGALLHFLDTPMRKDSRMANWN